MNAYMNHVLDAKGWMLRTGRSDGMTVVITGFVEPDCVYDLRLRLLADRLQKPTRH